MQKAAEVLVPPQLDPVCDPMEALSAAPGSAHSDPMEEFSKRLDDIIRSHPCSLMDKQEAQLEEVKDDVSMESEVKTILQTLNHLSSPEEKLQDLLRKYTDLVVLRRSDSRRMCVLQQTVSELMEERRSGAAARGALERLCRDLQAHHLEMREQTLLRCREDEEKRSEMSSHFQSMLTEIQTQIEQHSMRNDKLCQENRHLTTKLEGLMAQCEHREESLEKINHHRDLQQKLTEARLQQAEALLTEAEEKHKREKEYLLREAIDKTKKCFAMKEQELAMKKKLTLYSQKFDEFQETLAKSNLIYARFKKEMENMSEKMKKLEKESGVWKTRFENCNKALTDMMEERTEKGKEYDLFVLKIQKLEKLCRTLQEERKGLYEKIKEVRQTNLGIPSRIFGSAAVKSESDEVTVPPLPEGLEEVLEEDAALTADMMRLREEQAKLQEFANCLLATPLHQDEDEGEGKGAGRDLDLEEDPVSSALINFKTKAPSKEEPAVTVDPTPAAETKAEPAKVPAEVPAEVPTQVQVPAAAPVEVPSQVTAVLPAEVPTQVQVPAVAPIEVPSQATAVVPAEVPTQIQIPAQVQISTVVPAQIQAPAAVPVVVPAHVQVPAEVPTQVEVPAQVQVSAEVPAQVPVEVPAQVQVPAEVPAQVQVPAEVPAQVQVQQQEAAAPENTQKTATNSAPSKDTPKKKKKRNGKNPS